MSRLRPALWGGVALATVFALSGCGESAADSSAGGGSDPDTLVLASVPSEESQSLEEQYGLVIDAIEAETGKTVEMQSATDYAAVIEAQRAGQVQLAAYGPFSYVQAVDGGIGLEILGAAIESEGGEPGYQSYGIVPADSDIQDLEGFRDKNVCFVDPTSTSGYLYPTAGLIDAGIDPENDLEATFAGGHDASALSVADGTCDAGFAYDDIVDRALIESGQLEEGALRTVWESEVIAGSPVVASTDLSEELRAQLRTVFSEQLNKTALVESGACPNDDECVLPEDAWGFGEVDDAFYDGVREVCDVTEADACVN